jgi:amino acid permease
VLDLEVLLTIALFVGTVILALQVADAVFSIIDARSVRDEDDPENLTRNRIRELVRTIAVTAALAVIIAFGVDSAARLVWDEERPLIGALLLFGVGGVAFAVGMVAVIAVVRREHPTYARIRRDLRDRSSFTLDPDELVEFEERFARADRSRQRRSQAGTLLRAFAVIAVLVLSVLVIVAAAGAGDVRVLVGAAIAALLSVASFVVAVRAGSVRLTALDAVLDDQRAEVEALLERARIPQRGSVPGLRDRVARALTILREQQNR